MDALLLYLSPIFLLFLASIWYLFTRDIRVSNLQNKCVVITGCDTGFGHQLAVNLDALGLHVFAACLTDEGRQQLQAKCSDRLHTVLMDVTNSQDIQRCLELVETFLKTNKSIALLAIVNNAGIATAPGFFDWSSIQSIKKVFDVNLWGVLEVTKAFIPLLKKYKGRIVNIASALGKFALRGSGAYSASKFAIQCYSDVLRQELKLFGITVHIIDPGFFKTNITDMSRVKGATKQLWDSLSQEKKKEYGGEPFIQKILNRRGLLIFCQEMTPVMQAMEHAVTSSSPRLRYIVGWDHKLMWRWLAMLPSGMQDLFIERVLSVITG